MLHNRLSNSKHSELNPYKIMFLNGADTDLKLSNILYYAIGNQ